MDLKTTFVQPDKNSFIWWTGITILVVIISILHYTTPTMNWEYHLILMQSYFIPVLLAAFRFGIRGGLISALLITVFYLPHIMLQWGGFVETNMIRFLQILLFFVIGYMTGFKTEREKEEKEKFQRSASELSANLEKLKRQAEEIGLLEQQLRQVDRLSVIGELPANLAHEVRNPLGSIRGAAEILRSEAPDALKKSEFFQIIFGETDR
ncbi:MAG: sensor histidine kinase, partial [Calditrichales bacterium]